ncbi:hypothetical protein LY76DRAFT_677272 [Colletotrichum caudatum]|nr:hypothetical protein LY76DRAFT_677272 [Colletotrichum caudatum]
MMTENILRLATKIYVTTPDSFTNKEYLPSERPKNQSGDLIVWKLGIERLRNEGSALEYVKEHTTIPVPQVLYCGPDGDGAMSLTVEFVDGIMCEEVKDCCQLVVKNTNEFIEATVLLQLWGLTSDQTGLNGLVIPPPCILEFDNRATWNPRKSSLGKPYVFCYGDLSRSNIILDRETLKAKCIINWECAGYYLAELEGNPWRLNYKEYMKTFQNTDKIKREISLIIKQSS